MSFGRLKLGHLSSQNYGFWGTYVRMHIPANVGYFPEAQNFIFLGPKASLFDGAPPLDPLKHPKLSK